MIRTGAYIVLLVQFLFLPLSRAQNMPAILKIEGDSIPIKFPGQRSFDSREEAKGFLEDLIVSLRASGYAAASVDSLQEGDTMIATISVGQRYALHELRIATADKPYTDAVRFRPDKLGDDMNQEVLSDLRSRLLVFLQNNGQPFAAVSYDSIRIVDNRYFMKLLIDRGPLIRFDTIENLNKAKLSRGYLKAYTGIRPGEPYDERLTAVLDKRLDEIPFVSRERPSEIYFKGDEAKTRVFLENRKVNRFDFLLGVLPNNAGERKVLVTGQADVRLWNPFGSGEKITINWKRLQQRSQDLELYFSYPYIASSPLGADVRFELNKRDTLYININYDIGVQYQIRAGDFLEVYVDNLQTIVLNDDTSRIKQTRALPSILDSRSTIYGLNFNLERLDYVFNPRRGYMLSAGLFAGNKKIRESNTISGLSDPGDPPFDYGTLYDSLDLRSVKWGGHLEVQYFQPIARRQTLMFGLDGSIMRNTELLENELYRIGGTGGPRGFDEEAFLVSAYIIGTLEYRLLTGRNAYFNLFTDVGFIQREARGENRATDIPLGFGAGFNLETRAGIFGLQYALGRSREIPFDFRSSKIHFGYVNIF